MILISPLNWGIGHSTRIVPIIRILQKSNIPFIVAADGRSFYFLKKYVKSENLITAPKLNIKYARNHYFMPLIIFLQIPKLIIFKLKNKFWLKKIIKKYNIKIVISDNRFGLYTKETYNIFITHQLNIQVPDYLIFTKTVIDFLNIKELKKYNSIWIPDFEGSILSGVLSQKNINKKILYLGPLSRFVNFYPRNKKKSEKFDLVVIASGPEPQRTIFIEIIRKQVSNINIKTAIISGKPEMETQKRQKNITIFSHLNDDDFYTTIKNADIIITRAGYSTIMDLIAIGKTAILIPTPGQTEQEFLAKYLQKKNMFLYFSQKKFVLNEAINIFLEKKHLLEIKIASLYKLVDNQYLKQKILKNLYVEKFEKS